ncbi:hypothetical protein [Streptomyces sp. NPDC048309]|uniref:hypothetical protein n=1 Tax=Streptomyces sp. NPDC048309 TaxID=3154618 RepID=UPI0033E02DEF
MTGLMRWGGSHVLLAGFDERRPSDRWTARTGPERTARANRPGARRTLEPARSAPHGLTDQASATESNST